MQRSSRSLVGAVSLFVLACGSNPQRPDAGATTGGGSAATGGGSAATGGGSAATGGGSAATGGGSAATGGGSAATGGGSAAAGGGSAATGGGSTGGGDVGGGSAGGEAFDGGGLVGGETCATAVALPGNAFITASTAGLGNDYAFEGTNGCARVSSGTSAPDIAYTVRVPSGFVLTAAVTTPMWDATINVLQAPASTCGDEVDGGVAGVVTCLAGTDVATQGTDFVQWANATGLDQDVFIVIDGYRDMQEGDFSLDVRIVSPMAGDTCSTATPVTFSGASAALPSESLNNFVSDYQTGTGCIFGPGPDRVYSFSIPAGLRLTARATSMDNLALNVVDDVSLCMASPVECSVRANNASSGAMQTETLIVDNSTTMARPVLLIVDSLNGAASFSLDLSVATPPAGETCADATPIVLVDGGVTLPTETLNGFVSDFAFTLGCEFGNGPDRVYRATVPANQRLLVRATSSESLSLSAVDTLAQCDPLAAVCSRAVDAVFSGAMQVETLSIENSTPAPRDIFLVVDSSSPPSSTFSLELTAGPVPAGETCAAPTAVTLVDGGVTLTGESLTTFVNDFVSDFVGTPGCNFGPGNDRVYAVPVPANARVVVSSTSTADLALSAIESAGACMRTPLVCSAAADNGTMGTETLRYDNATGAAQTMLLVVDSFSMPGTFDLDVRIGRLPYATSQVSAACDDFATITPTPQLTGSTTPALADDVVTDTQALPFAFSYFGTAVTHFSVSSNGFLQLFTSSAETGETGVTHQRIPLASTPNGVVAPFWSDLVAEPTTRVVSGVFGTGPNRRFTVQWEDSRPIGVTGASVTVQARLFEGTNVIELHACTLTAGSDPSDADRERGLQATVGLEATDGLDGMQYSYDRASLTAGQLLRFTP